MTISKNLFVAAVAMAIASVAYSQDAASYYKGGRASMTMAGLDSALAQDPGLCYGNFRIYSSEPLVKARTKKALDGGTPAPKGYRPVYISTLVRHGARYCIGDGYYAGLMNFLRVAKDSAQLTPKGLDFYARYEKIFPEIDGREGELTQKGYNQHREIARWLYESYPEVFKGKTVAKALSTNVPRTIMSMQAEVSELSSLDPDIDVEAEASRIAVRLLDPSTGAALPKPVRTKVDARGHATRDSLDRALGADKVSVCAEFLKDPDFAHRHYRSGRSGFSSAVRHVVIDAGCVDPSPDFSGFLSDGQMAAMYKMYVYNGYLNYGMSPVSDRRIALSTYTLVRDFVSRADEDMADGTGLRLRFGHDTGLLPFLSLIGVNGFGVSSADPDKILPNWSVYDIPMACNFVLVFYRPKDGGGETLVKAMLNGREATLPLDSESGPYYSWSALRAYLTRVADTAAAAFASR